MLSVKARLQNMLDVSRQLTECVRRNQLTEADIMSDVDVQWMVSTPITYLSEQAARMLADHREDAERLNEIDWYSLRGLRNRIVHDYDGVNFALLAAYVLHDVPDLIPVLEGILDRLDPDK